MKIEILLESDPPVKLPFLTAFSKTNEPNKMEELGTWQASILFKNVPGYPRVIPYVPKIASKWTSSYLSTCIH